MAEFENTEEFGDPGNHAFGTIIRRSLLWLSKRGIRRPGQPRIRHYHPPLTALAEQEVMLDGLRSYSHGDSVHDLTQHYLQGSASRPRRRTSRKSSTSCPTRCCTRPTSDST